MNVVSRVSFEIAMTEQEYVRGSSTNYKFSGDFDKVIDQISKVIWRDRDNYPLEVLLSAVGTNGARFVSNPLIVHQFKPEMVVYCLQNPINEQL